MRLEHGRLHATGGVSGVVFSLMYQHLLAVLISQRNRR
jgi:hypothetical protein